MKPRINLLSLLMTLPFLAALILTSATSASAATDYVVLSRPMVSDNDVSAMGTVFLNVVAGNLKDGDTVSFRLPEGLVWTKPGTKNTPMTNYDWTKKSDGYSNYYGHKDGNYISVPEHYSGDDNALYDVDLEVVMLSEREISVRVIGEPSSQVDAYMHIYPKHIWVEEGYLGPVNLIAEAPASSNFPSGVLKIAYVNVIGGTVSVKVTSINTFRDKDVITLRITEEASSCFIAKNESLKLKLPSGFTWSNVHSVKTIWGDSDFVDNFITIKTDGDELIMDVGGVSKRATSIEFKATINAENKVFARPGVVIVKASGESHVSPSRLWVGEYNPYDLNEDSDTNILDLLWLNQLINDGYDYEEADVNFDGKVDLLDLLTVAQNVY